MKVERSAIEVHKGALIPMLETSEIQPTRPHEPHLIECCACRESLSIEEDVLFQCSPGVALVFPCPKCNTMKVIGTQTRLVIGNAITGPDSFGRTHESIH